MQENKIWNSILIFSFLLVIFFPLINTNTKLIKDIKSYENRKLRSKPKFELKKLDPFPEQFEKYYNDHFTLRSALVKFHQKLNFFAFNKSPMPSTVIIGKDNWLFMADGEDQSYWGKNNLKYFELKSICEELQFRKNYYEKKGIKFYFVVAPAKAQIYPEKIPFNEFRINKESWGEQLINFLKKNSSVNVINVYSDLRKNKGPNLLYFKLDNHWNQLGGFVAANRVLETMKKDFPIISINNLVDYSIEKKQTQNGNIAGMISNIGNYFDEDYQLEPKNGFKSLYVPKVEYPPIPGFAYPNEYEIEKENPDKSKPKLLIVSDSFGASFFPFMAEQFSRTTKIFDAWLYTINDEIVEKEKPDAVVLLVLESHLRCLLNNQAIKDTDLKK